MKVTTDACLFGAWVAAVHPNTASAGHLLDVGTGTGLLSLMFVQQHFAIADAVETDAAAAAQAAYNFQASPWPQQLRVINSPVQSYKTDTQYDCIISNPPFHEKQLGTNNNGKQLAHHDSGLLLHELLEIVQLKLAPAGHFYLLLPHYRESEAVLLAARNRLYPLLTSRVKQSPAHPFFRSMLCFTKKPATVFEETITIAQGGNYTPAFTALLQPYYLKL